MMLRDYKRCTARRDYLMQAIEYLSKQIETEKGRAMTDEALHGIDMSGMPHGTMPGNPVESLVLRYASGYKPQYIQYMDADLQQMRDELAEVTTVCKCVEAWMQALNDKERKVVQAHIIHGLSWAEVLPLFRADYSYTSSRDGLRYIQRTALDKIYDAAR